MSELNTKIALLYKTYAEWRKIWETFVPLRGEVCFCEFPKDKKGKQEVLFKVGNGENTFKELNWVRGISPDFNY